MITAKTPDEFIAAIERQLVDPSTAAGRTARTRVTTRYSWQAQMSFIDRYLPALNPAQPR